MPQIIELDTYASVKQVANCADSFPAFVQSRFGNRAEVVYRQVVDGKAEGTIRTARGEYWDVIYSEQGYRAVKA